MEKGLISVIVPVYNAKKYIEKCAACVLNQTYTNWELIFVNDGSEDETGLICKEMCKNNNKVRYFEKTNGGPASARNVGIHHANGEFMYFMDVDDILHENALKALIDAYRVHNVDFVIANSLRIDIYGNEKREWTDKDILYANREEIEHLVEQYANDIKSNKVLWSAWGKLYRTDIVENNGLRFNEDVHAWEDVLFVFTYLVFCNSCYYLGNCLYTYCHFGQDNVASGRSWLGPMDFKYTIDEIKKILCDKKFQTVIENCYSEYAIWSMFNNIRLMPGSIPDYRKKLYNNIHELVNDRMLQESIHSYVQKHEDNAKIIPFLIRHKMTRTVIWVFKLQIFNKRQRGKK